MSEIEDPSLHVHHETFEDVEIEKKTKDFVESKTGEKIYVDCKNASNIKIIPKSKNGSMALGILWIKVLQHPRNYPVTKYMYKKQLGMNNMYNIILTLNDVTIHIDLKTGLIHIKGRFVLEWFMKYFKNLLDVYDGVTNQETYKNKPLYTEEEVKRIDLDVKTNQQFYADNWPEYVLNEGVSVLSISPKPVAAGNIDNDVPLDLQVPGIRDTDLMMQEELDKQTSNLTPGSITEGPHLYRLWRSLLNGWCSNENSTIYIVTPRIDTTRLIEICHFCIKHRQTVNIGAICIPMHFDGCLLADIKRSTLKRFSAQEQMFIEYRIFTHFLYPLQNFEAKFIASLNQDGIANVFVTSADFNKSGFSRHNKNMVVFNSIREEEFKTKYLNPVMDY